MAKTIPSRSCRLSPDRGDGTRRILQMFVGKTSFTYWLEQIPADYGLGFSLEKWGGEEETYAVHLDPDSCECLGWLRWGKCKHVSATLALIAAGRLTGKVVA